MASTAPAIAATPDTLITIKIAYNGSNRRFKLPLQELNATLFPTKLRSILQVPQHQQLILERFSDSSSGYISLDPNVPSSYKQLYRAAKAKLKLRIKATVSGPQPSTLVEASKEAQADNKTAIESVVAEPVVQPEPKPELSQMLTKEAETPSAETAKAAPLQLIPEAGDLFSTQLKVLQDTRELNRQFGEIPALPALGFQVSCDICNKPISDTHFHCSICSNGDYDLCESCIDAGKVCPGERHWMIKRYIKNGQIVCNNTDRVVRKVASKKSSVTVKEPDMPGAFHVEYADVKPQPVETEAVRTCNGCVRVLSEKVMVSCSDCDDFDLCAPCHLGGKTGHHPGHTFAPLVDDDTVTAELKALCPPGRNVRHDAICDGCDENISGVRHKCLDCPDWDYCNDCLGRAKTEHKDHRFVPVYEPLGLSKRISELAYNFHFGVYCDGPVCKSKSNQYYIRGVRYKCAICNDTDFCAVCEAHPSNEHNPTHPLIKFKTRVKNVSVSTVGEDAQGTPLPAMGDNKTAQSSSTVPQASSTVASPSHSPKTTAEGTPNLTTEPKITPDPSQIVPLPVHPSSELDAHFIKDLVKDGTAYAPDVQFRQVWTLGNPGPHAWPIGCSVRRVGGDNMLDIRRSHAASLSELAAANESNLTTYMVPPGQRFSFTVTMRTPQLEGKHISYWRLKAPDGTAFGHKLWCDVEVKNALPHPESTPVLTTRGPSRIRYPGAGDGLNHPCVSVNPCSRPKPAAGETPTICDNEHRRRYVQQLQQQRREQMEEQRAKLWRGRRSMPTFPHNRLSAPPEDDAERKFAAIKNQLNLMEEANERQMAALSVQRKQMIQRFREHQMSPNPQVDAACQPMPPLSFALPDRPNPTYTMATQDRKSALAAAAASTTAAAAALAKAEALTSAARQADLEKNAESSLAAPLTQATPPAAPKSETTEDEAATELKGSAMVYPKLEKESPASSTQLERGSVDIESVAAVPTETGSTNDTASAVETETVTSAGEPAADEIGQFETVSAAEVDMFELHEDEASDDDDAPFEYLTDEEYDILDASDEEYANAHGAGL